MGCDESKEQTAVEQVPAERESLLRTPEHPAQRGESSGSEAANGNGTSASAQPQLSPVSSDEKDKLEDDEALARRLQEEEEEANREREKRRSEVDGDAELARRMAEADAEDGETFAVTVERRPGRLSLGLDIDALDQIQIDAVNDGGLIQEWNQNNPSHAIRPGDTIVGANGCTDSPEAILGTINAESKVTLMIRRVTEAMSSSPAALPQPADGGLRYAVHLSIAEEEDKQLQVL